MRGGTIPAGLVLVGRAGCHLCDDARPVVAALAEEYGLGFQELSITEHPELADAYFELIPVVLLDGVAVSQWWVDETDLRAAIRGGTPPV